MRNLKAPKVPQDDVAVPADTPFGGGDYLQRLDKALSQALAPPPKQDARFDHDLNSPANRRARGEHVSPEQEGPLPPACQLIDRVPTQWAMQASRRRARYRRMRGEQPAVFSPAYADSPAIRLHAGSTTTCCACNGYHGTHRPPWVERACSSPLPGASGATCPLNPAVTPGPAKHAPAACSNCQGVPRRPRMRVTSTLMGG